ncbi:MAG TPA: hypothetical protein VMR79_10275 [Verrucomicrobiae bacterium]|nr:hypothetical protein [Verrucomicrobiae bacterium]
MLRRSLPATLALASLLAACKGPAVPNPMTGQTRFLCCNLHYEKPEISDANYLKGTLIPYGTHVQVLEVRKNTVKFQAEGHPPITLVLKYGKDTLGMDEYLNRIFLREDPHVKLPKPSKDKKQAAAVERTRKLIEEGTVEPGMTKDEVLMAVGYPPVHRTPSLSSPNWTYWQNRWVTFEVYFDGDKVSRVQR